MQIIDWYAIASVQCFLLWWCSVQTPECTPNSKIRVCACVGWGGGSSIALYKSHFFLVVLNSMVFREDRGHYQELCSLPPPPT